MSGRAVTYIGIGLLLLVIGVFAQSYNGRVHLHNSQVTACTRGLLDRADAIQADMDLATFAGSASAKRRADGDDGVATQYARVADNAARRVQSRSGRLLGANVRSLLVRKAGGGYAPSAFHAAMSACGRANPSPSLVD